MRLHSQIHAVTLSIHAVSPHTKTFVQKNLSRTFQKSTVINGGTANVCLIVEKRPSPDQADCDLTAHENLGRKSTRGILL